MSTLDIKFKHHSIYYIILTIFILLFSLIYNNYSHGVSSIFMTYAFLIPLIFGLIPTIIFHVFQKDNVFSSNSFKFYNSSILTFTIYSVIQGVLEIYGTTNFLVIVYLMVGILFLFISFIIYLQNLILRID